MFPEVAWDRTAGSGKSRIAFGWLPRPDGRADFLVLEFTADGRVGMTTSSAELSLEFHRRLYGTDKGHGPCQRIEHMFTDAGIEVTSVIALDAPRPHLVKVTRELADLLRDWSEPVRVRFVDDPPRLEFQTIEGDV